MILNNIYLITCRNKKHLRMFYDLFKISLFSFMAILFFAYFVSFRCILGDIIPDVLSFGVTLLL